MQRLLLLPGLPAAVCLIHVLLARRQDRLDGGRNWDSQILEKAPSDAASCSSSSEASQKPRSGRDRSTLEQALA